MLKLRCKIHPREKGGRKKKGRMTLNKNTIHKKNELCWVSIKSQSITKKKKGKVSKIFMYISTEPTLDIYIRNKERCVHGVIAPKVSVSCICLGCDRYDICVYLTWFINEWKVVVVVVIVGRVNE